MTFKEVFKQLDAIDGAAVSLLGEAGFDQGEGLGEGVRPLRDRAQDAFMRRATEDMLDMLATLHDEYACLSDPISGEYRLEPFIDGRYGFFDGDGNAHGIPCGRTIEARIPDRLGRPRWVRCRVGHDGSDYYIRGHRDVPLDGLAVRMRGVRHDL